MRVLYDHFAFTRQAYGGVSRYYVNLINYLMQRGVDISVHAPLHKNKYLMGSGLGGVCLGDYPGVARHLLNSINNGLYKIRRSVRPNIIHETYFSSQPLNIRGVKRVVTIHDMIHELYPQYFSRFDITKLIKRSSCKRADAIICVSESTKSDLLAIYGEELPVTVIPHGVIPQSLESIKEYIRPAERPYLVFVGQRQGYKNFESFIRAFSISDRVKSEFDVKCVGGGQLSTRELREFHSLGLSNGQVAHISGDDEVLAAVYVNARALVYPSLYEGFGMPLLESMSYGCPVICSDTSSLPEVGGEVAIYFDPKSIESMVACLEENLFSDSVLSRASSIGFEHIKKYSWESCSHKTKSLYNSLI